jgi:hypothetical protein
VDLLSVLTHGPLRGYDRANAKAALACFVERRLIIIDQTEIKNCKE